MQSERGLRLGRPFGTPLVFHVSWLPAAVLLVLQFVVTAFGSFALGRAVVLSSIALGAFVVSVWLHELAHLAAGRSRSRPLATTVYIFGGVAVDGPAPVTTGVTRAVAGPLMSGLIGVAAMAAARVLVGEPAAVVRSVGWSNLALAGVNLLPAYPLDAGAIIRTLVARRSGDHAKGTRIAARWGRVLGIVLAAAGLWGFFGGLALTQGAATFLWVAVVGLSVALVTRPAERMATLTSAVRGRVVADLASTFGGRVSVSDPAPERVGSRPMAVADRGRLAGVIPSGTRTRGGTAADVMVPWDERRALRTTDPLEPALARLGSVGGGVLVVLDEEGVVRGALDAAVVRRRLARL